MNDNRHQNEVKTAISEAWEAVVKEAAAQFDYPQTPNISDHVTSQLSGSTQNNHATLSRRLAWAASIVLLIFALTTLTLPTVRAAIRQFLQFGAVRIESRQPATDLVANDRNASTDPHRMLQSVANLEGATDLATARNMLSIPIRLPTYPVDLCEPDRVVVQKAGDSGNIVHLIWFDQANENQVRMSLMILEADALVTKIDPANLTPTTVHGTEALWAKGPYEFLSGANITAVTRLIDGHVLIWTENLDGELVTHRLETDLPRKEAVRIAESLEKTVQCYR